MSFNDAYSPEEPKSLGGYATLTLTFTALVGTRWQPRLTRTAASSLAIVTAADYLQQAWAAVDKRA
jgi:hypothetical protein